MADVEARKLLDKLWAGGSSGQRTDPDASSLTPPLDRSIGWPAGFSSSGGNKLRRRVWNQIMREMDGASSDVSKFGLLPYDANIDYEQGAVVSVGTVTYRCLVANGPSSTAVNPTADSQTSWESVTRVAKAPNIPLSFGVSPSNGVLLFRWLCPLDNGAKISSFLFEWRIVGDRDWTQVANFSDTFYRLAGLDNNVAVEARVRAVNSSGNGNWTDIISGTPIADVPDVVEGLVAFSGDSTFIDLRWNEPNDNGAQISNYILQWRQNNQNFSSSRELETSNQTARISNLTNGIRYYFRIKAINEAGDSPWSTLANAQPMAPAPPPPQIPDNTIPDRIGNPPSGLAFGATAIFWEWDVPLAGRGKEQEGGQVLTGFDFQWRESGDNWAGNITRVTSSCIYLSSLTSGLTYEGRARAINDEGQSAWSPVGSLNLAVGPIPAGSFVGTGSGTSVAWEWDAVGGADSYELETRQGNAAWASVSVTGTSRTTTGHTAGVAVQGRVRAVVDTETGPWHAVVTVAIIPAATTLSGASDTVAEVDFTWVAPNNGGSAITSYDFEYRVSSGEWVSSSVNGLTTTISSAVPIQARVRARTIVGVAEWSSITTLITPLVGGVGGFNGVGSGRNVAWTWNAVAGATAYRLETRQGSGLWAVINLGSSSRSRTTTGHIPGTAVQGRIRAVIGSRNGSYSNRTVAIIPAATSIRGSSSRVGEVDFTWSAPSTGGSAITSYDFEYRTAGDEWVSLSVSGTSRTISSTAPIQARVRARNVVGPADWSGITSLVTPLVATVGGFRGTGSGTSVSWSWNTVAGADRYELETRQGTEDWATISLTGTSRTTSSHRAGVAVQGRVRAIVGAVTGNYANRTVAIVPASTSVSGSSNTIGEVDFRWVAPQNGGSAITSYDFEYQTSSSNWITRSTTSTSITITTSARIRARVRARNNVGPAEWSGVTSLITPLVGTISGFSGTASGRSVSWSWNALTGADSYQLETRQGNGNWARQTTTGTSLSSSGHTAGTAVQGRVRAVLGSVTGTYATRTVGIIPGTPTISGRASDIGEITYSWSAPGAGGLVITSYDLQTQASNGSWVTRSGLTSRSRVVSTTSSTRARVRARNAVGAGNWSNATSYIAPGVLPSAVTITSSQTWRVPSSWSFVSTISIVAVSGDGGGGGGGGGGGEDAFGNFGRYSGGSGGTGYTSGRTSGGGSGGGADSGGSGGRGGSNGNGSTGTSGTNSGGGGGGGGSGERGGTSSVVRGTSTLVSIDGGIGGAGGGGGGGGGRFGGGSGSSGSGGSGGGTGGSRGSGGAGRGHSDGGRGGSGGRGSSGSSRTASTSISSSDSFVITVGSGGRGGGGGRGGIGEHTAGNGGSGSSGSNGSNGRVTITPTG